MAGKPKGTKAQKENKRHIVAKGKIAGKSAKAIAREAGCSERHAARIAAEPETDYLIAEAYRPHKEQMMRLAKKGLDCIEAAMNAHKDDEEDHVARLRAVERYGDVAEMVNPKQQESKTETHLITWEQFVAIYNSRTAAG